MTTNGTPSGARNGVRNGAAKTYRVAAIGHTGRGGFGHGLDVAWQGLPGISIDYVAVADPVEEGRTAAARRTGAKRAYADYHELLERERGLDFVSIGPRWMEQHVDMVRACTAAGVRGIFLEKPMAATPGDCDVILAACRAAGTVLEVGHGRRFDPWIHRTRALIAAGKIGQLLAISGNGKCDRRGGPEDTMVLGTHMFDLMRLFAGDVAWAWGRITLEGRDLRPADVIEGAEGMGASGGDGVVAHYAFGNGVAAYWESRKELGKGKGNQVFGLTFHGSDGILSYRCSPDDHNVFFYPRPWAGPGDDTEWEPIAKDAIALPPDTPAYSDRNDLTRNNKQVLDLIAALEEGREPYANGKDARAAVEMVTAIAESHRTGARVPFPLDNRANPYDALRRGETAVGVQRELVRA